MYDDYLSNYQNLAIAIIKSGCDDYKYGKMSEEVFYRFCKSGWFSTLLALIGTREVSGEWIFEQMKKEREEYLDGKKERKKWSDHKYV